MQAAKLTKLDMGKKMATSRSQLDRVLDPTNISVHLDMVIKAARALGKEIEIKIKRAPKKGDGSQALLHPLHKCVIERTPNRSGVWLPV